jgi:1,4-alpha-glucan branching enzyme
MGKQKLVRQKVTFSYSAPIATSVMLAGDFTGWQQAPIPMKKSKTGVWTKTVSLAAGEYEYRLLVDGEWVDDPLCANRRPNQFGGFNCVYIVLAAPA